MIVPPAAPDAGRKLALIGRYFRATRLRETSIDMIWTMSRTASPPVPLTADQRPVYDEVVTEVAGLTFDRVARAYTDLYADAFTVEELEALVAFYESPVGQSLMAKTADLAGRSAEIVPRMSTFFSETLRTRICQRIACAPPAAPVVSAY